MKEKLVRWKFYFDKDKEEQWLNEMADKGWNMKKSRFGIYIFEHSDKPSNKHSRENTFIRWNCCHGM